MHTHLRAGGFNTVASRPFARTVFTPLSLSPALWLDASDPATLYQDSALTTAATADGDPVGGWKDKSGNGRNATQATASARPTLKLAIQNGKPVLRLDGVDDILDVALTGGAANTIFLVATNNGVSKATLSVQSGDGPILQNEAVFYDTRVASVVTGQPYFGATFSVVSMTLDFTAQAYSLWQNGTSKFAVTPATGAVPTGAWRLGGFGGARRLLGDIAEVALYSSVLSTASRQRVEAYLKSKWGTP